MNKKIAQLYHGPLFKEENFTEEIQAEEFTEIDLKGRVKLVGYLMKIEEGIIVFYKSIKFSQKSLCVLCAKELTIPREIKNTEWIYYETAPKMHDDFFEQLLIDKKQMEINLTDSLRQEILLNFDFDPHCQNVCVKEKPVKEEKKDPGIKALAKLKEMWKD